jgi:hypothetical protein
MHGPHNGAINNIGGDGRYLKDTGTIGPVAVWMSHRPSIQIRGVMAERNRGSLAKYVYGLGCVQAPPVKIVSLAINMDPW